MAIWLKEGNLLVTRNELQDVMDEVEKLGSHPRLSDIVAMLEDLQNGRRISSPINGAKDFTICEGVSCR